MRSAPGTYSAGACIPSAGACIAVAGDAAAIVLRAPWCLACSGCPQPSIRCPEGEHQSTRRRISVDRCFRSLDTELAGRNPEEVGNDVVLVLVVMTALAFDFTNGFHD